MLIRHEGRSSRLSSSPKPGASRLAEVVALQHLQPDAFITTFHRLRLTASVAALLRQPPIAFASPSFLRRDRHQELIGEIDACRYHPEAAVMKTPPATASLRGQPR